VTKILQDEYLWVERMIIDHALVVSPIDQ
jgi:hypothetical protein